MREAFLSGVETLIEYKSTKSAIMQQLNQLENELHLLENSKPEDDSQTRIKRAMDSTIREFLLGESSIELKKAAVCAIIDKCVWDKS
ncbi:MAG: hypothetical protein N2Z65_05440, partial [Clostridiales bacterium]|nr:hypothetical protein [Clostridiales bacterium]